VPTDDRELIERLLVQLAMLGSTITNALAANTNSEEFIGDGPLLVLCVLDLEGPQRPASLQQLVGLTSGGTSRLLDRMEGANLVTRAYGTIDRDSRGVEVSLTDTGRAAIRRATTAVAKVLPESKAVAKDIVAIIEDLDR
jgi:DNA-binding MarR family transcriptional regulator